MWLCTTIGFYSAVAHRNEAGMVLVRARCRADLERLCEHGELDAGRLIKATPNADYPFRVRISRSLWCSLVADLADDVDYDNFKGAVGNANPPRARIYHEAWAVFRGIEREQAWAPVRFGRALNSAPAGGTLLVDVGDHECTRCQDFRWVEDGEPCPICNLDADPFPF